MLFEGELRLVANVYGYFFKKNMSQVVFFFLMQTILKSLLNLLQYYFSFMFCFFGPKTCRIVAPQPGIEPMPLELTNTVLTTGPPGKSQRCVL